MQQKTINYTLFFCFLSMLSFSQLKETSISGIVLNETKSPVAGALVQIKDLNKGVLTDIDGKFVINIFEKKECKIEVTYLGYKKAGRTVLISKVVPNSLIIKLEEIKTELQEVIIKGKSIVQNVQERAYNVSVVDAKKLHNTSLDLGHALDRVSGVRVRESGGVGSQMSFSLNGFKGNQVRFFIDGVPMDNLGTSFQINNIPINLAERIEVYKGVVPVGLGSDALGGAVNIITNSYKKSHLEASYSFGSYNTHKSAINAIYVAKSGFITQINAYQNYSNNNYKVRVDIADLKTGQYFPNQIVKRFHDTYHNESVILNVGLINKRFADQFLFGITLGQNYQEIQTGARIVSVFGKWHREGNIIMPSLKYKKDNFLIKNLDFRINANINLGQERNIDTINRRYNWFGDYKEYPTVGGERSYSLYKYKNNSGIATANLSYKISEYHSIVASDSWNTFNRIGHNELDPSNQTYEQPKKTIKNVIGLGYDYKKENWNSSIFFKQYHQKNRFAQPYNPTGNYGDVAYTNQENKFSSTGYGLAVAHFLNENFQIKASYEKSYRLPESNELYGDVINLQGNIDLRSESSDNFNLGSSLWWTFKAKHVFNFSASGFYRNAVDFIRPRLNSNQSMQVMDNLGSVISRGIEADVQYTFDTRLSIRANMSYQDLRNNTKYEEGQTTVSVVYKDRIPNMPYLYGNLDVTYTFPNLWNKKNQLSIGYNALYVHAFYLYWPSLGSKKLDVAEQISHDIALNYSFSKKLQFTLEGRNLLDRDLYDNFSLQKPGRSFTAKIKYNFF